MPTLNFHKPKKSNSRSGQAEENRKARQKVYNSTIWANLRKAKLQTTPLCERCEKENKVVQAADVHHKISFMTTTDPAKREQLAYSPDNLESICKSCHAKEHKRQKIN